jgi:hypothetical protein
MTLPVQFPCPHHSRRLMFRQGFLLLAAASGQTSHPGGHTGPGTEAGSSTTSPVGQTMIGTGAGGPTANPGGLTTPRTGADGPTATPGGLTDRPCAAPPSPTSPTSAASHAATSTLAAPHTVSMTPTAPPTALVSQLYPLHYSRRPQATQEPPTPPLHQHPPPAKAIPVTPPVNPHLMTTRVKRGFRIPTDKLSLSATSSLTLSPVPTSVRTTLTNPS